MSKKPWEQWPELWKSEAAWLSYVRGGIRRGLWNKYPPKLEFLKSRVVLKENTNPRSMKRYPLVKRWQCEECKGWFDDKLIQVDHRRGHNSLRSVDEIGSYVEAILRECTFEDYAILCKHCHEIKSYSDAHNISFEDAKLTKQIIQMEKDKTLKKFLDDHGVTCKAAQRREKALEILRKEGRNE